MTAPHTKSRAPVLMLLAMTASACTTWRVERGPLPAPLNGRTLQQIRILTRDRDTVIVYAARLQGDSIVGLSLPPDDDATQRIAVATGEVAQVQYRAGTIWKTIYTATATVVITTLLVTLALAAICAGAVATA
jgi:hypothetical protein